MTAAHKAAEAGATGLAVAQAGLNAVLKANPIGLVVSLLAALAAGLVTAYKSSESFPQCRQLRICVCEKDRTERHRHGGGLDQ